MFQIARAAPRGRLASVRFYGFEFAAESIPRAGRCSSRYETNGAALRFVSVANLLIRPRFPIIARRDRGSIRSPFRPSGPRSFCTHQLLKIVGPLDAIRIVGYAAGDCVVASRRSLQPRSRIARGRVSIVARCSALALSSGIFLVSGVRLELRSKSACLSEKPSSAALASSGSDTLPPPYFKQF